LPNIEDVCKRVKRRVTPDRRLRAAVHAKAEEIRAAVDRECRKADFSAEVRVDGSVAKDTWLPDYADVDVFMRVSSELTKEQLRGVCLPIAERALAPNKIVERFAEHPYVESTVELDANRALRVNVVPCYRVERGQWLSATDRSPYHTEYIQQHLTTIQRDDVRLLKAFLRGIGSYGADIKTGGFSGMLCETLIASHTSFLNVVNEFTSWHESKFIDIENYFHGRGEEIHRVFREPLIVIDPIDRGRNLAAAVRREQLWNFVAASRQLVAKPSLSYFETPKIRPIQVTAYRREMKKRGSALLAVAMGRMNVVVDILWSQLYKTERALLTLLKTNGFTVIKSMSWSNEQSLSVILLELEQTMLPNSKRHLGPPVSRNRESASFLAKHATAKGTLSGPWIEADKWVVQKKREITSAIELFRASLPSGGRAVGVAAEPARSFRKRVEVLSGEGIERLIVQDPNFASALRTFLSGKPTWLD